MVVQLLLLAASQTKHKLPSFLPLLLSFLLLIAGSSSGSTANAKEAMDIPRANTPSPNDGAWPQSNVTGCGFPGLPRAGVLDECTEALGPSAPDIRGYWKNTATDEIDELIEMCGTRWIDTSRSVLHDFPSCTGVVGDGLGCQDYSGPDIMSKNGLCTPIVVACRFEENCVNLYAPNPTAPQGPPFKAVSRCPQPNGTMVWIHPVAGTVLYSKVPEGEEPNCMECVGGQHDGVVGYDPATELPCPYQERRWKRCNNDTEGSEGSNDSSGDDGGDGSSDARRHSFSAFSRMLLLPLIALPFIVSY